MIHKYDINLEENTVKKEEEILYNSIRGWLLHDSSDLILEKFNYLFLKGNGCDCYQSRSALEMIISSRQGQREFNFIFNRCCQIIIYEWQINPLLKSKIPLLIKQIEAIKYHSHIQARTKRKLRSLIIEFKNSEQYLKLVRFSILVGQSTSFKKNPDPQYLRDLISQYPYLYQRYLVGEGSSYEFKKTIINLQKRSQHHYELNLSRYITYRVRLMALVRQYKAQQKTKISKKVLHPVKNPTLIKENLLEKSLHYYWGEIVKGYTHRSWAMSCRDQLAGVSTHVEFKAIINNYLSLDLNCTYSKETLLPKISEYLDVILPDIHLNQVDEFTLLRASSLLFQLLIVDGKRNCNHSLLIELINNLGIVKVVGLLLKIVLLCDKSKPYLEQRLAILFSYYELQPISKSFWLIEMFENLQLAFSVHFENVDLSLIKIIDKQEEKI